MKLDFAEESMTALSSVDHAMRCLELLGELEPELQAAIEATAANDLRGLELALWRQEMACISLRRLTHQMERSGFGPEARLALAREVRNARLATLTFAKLIELVGTANRTLTAVCDMRRSLASHPATPSCSVEV